MLQLSPKRALLQQVPSESKRGVKKPVLVSAISMPVTETRKETVKATKVAESVGVGKDGEKSEDKCSENFVRVPCIRYSINCRKKSVSALFDSGGKINAVHLAFAKELGFFIRLIDVRVQKIDDIILDTYGMVVAAFSMKDKANRVRFFQEIFLVANVSPEVFLGMLFFTLSSADIDFSGQQLQWRTYTTGKTLPTIRHVKLVDKKEFAAAAFDPEHKTYVIHVRPVSSDALPSSSPLNIHFFRKSQISGLIVKEAPIKVFVKYSDFAYVFSSDLAFELLEHSGINNHTIKLVDDCQQPLYGSIYSLKLVELETLKAYIETNLTNGFIRLSKSLVKAPILFDRKSNGFLCLCVNYHGFNNFTIKNQYLLSLIGELLDKLGRAMWFT